MIIFSVIFTIGLLALILRIAIGAIFFVSTLFLGALSFILCPIIILAIIIGGLFLGLIIIRKLLGAIGRAFG